MRQTIKALFTQKRWHITALLPDQEAGSVNLRGLNV
jgi:hypothetical protein